MVLFQSETEWQGFQRHCLEIVAKLAELLPGETFSLLVMIDFMCVGFLVLAQRLISEINFSTIIMLCCSNNIYITIGGWVHKNVVSGTINLM